MAFLNNGYSNRYTYNEQFDKALHCYLRLRRPAAFDLITKHNLFPAIQEKVLFLMECDQEKALALFVDNTDKISVCHPPSLNPSVTEFRCQIKRVMEQLTDQPCLQHAYLHSLFVTGTQYSVCS